MANIIQEKFRTLVIGQNALTKSLAIGPNRIKLGDRIGLVVSDDEMVEIGLVAAVAAKKGKSDIIFRTLDNPSQVVAYIRKRKSEQLRKP